VDCNLPVKATSLPDPGILESFQQTSLEHLNKLRMYLGLCRLLKYQLTADVQNVSTLMSRLYVIKIIFLLQKLEQDFVEMRKTDEHMNANLFHFMLDMAR